METGTAPAERQRRHTSHRPRSTPAGVLPTQRREWLFNAARHLAGGQTAFLLDCGAHSALPLLRSSGPTPRLTLPGAAATGESCDLPWSSTQELQTIAARLAEQSLPIELPRVPADSPTLAALRQAFHLRGWVQTRPAPGRPCLDLHAGWSTPLSQFDPGRRTEFRLAECRAEALGGVRHELHTQVEGAALERLLDEALALEALSWPVEHGGASTAPDAATTRFFRHYAQTAMRAGLLRVALLRIGTRLAAMQVTVESGGRLWLLRHGYDPGLSRCVPADLLMLHTLGEAAKRGLRALEFMGSVTPWVLSWASGARPHVRVRLYPASLQGAKAWYEDMAAALAERRRAARPIGRPLPVLRPDRAWPRPPGRPARVAPDVAPA